jgi:hypothetical protein
LLEKVARIEFASDSDNFDLLTLIYVLLGKLKAASIIWNRSKNAESQKIQAFLNLNFDKPENKLKAEKNAFALIGKQRFGKHTFRHQTSDTVFRACISIFHFS